MNLENEISAWLKEYFINNKMESFVIGVSGGIDSAVASTLCAMTRKKTYVVIMPIFQNEDETNRGRNHCKWLKSKFVNIEIIEKDLTELFEKLKNDIPEKFHNKLGGTYG